MSKDIRYLVVFACINVFLALTLNSNADLASGTVSRFENQAQIIRGGFDPSLATDASTLTYPMWGYGWFFAITQNRLIIKVIQSLFGLAATIYLMKVLSGEAKTKLGRFTMIGLTAIALPWYCLHTTITLYAIASSILVVAVALFLVAESYGVAIASGLLFGLCLNFRSDYLLMPIGFIAIMVICRQKNFRLIGTWLISISVMMVPWFIHTNSVTDQGRLTSTNGGHAMFVGLGQLPNNVWGITASDRDPLMMDLVRKEFGAGVSTLSYRADSFLKHEFKQRVVQEPLEYTKKVAHSTIKAMTQGAYPGEFLNRPNEPIRREEIVSRCRRILFHPIAFTQEYGVGQAFRTLLMIASYAFTIITVFLSFLAVPLNLWFGIKLRHAATLIVVGCIVYQLLLQMFIYNLPWYTSTVLLFHFANLGFAADHWGRRS